MEREIRREKFGRSPKVLKEAADIYEWEVMRERNSDKQKRLT